MSDQIIIQAANIIPPRKNNILPIAVDATSRAYEFRNLNIFEGKLYTADQYGNAFFVSLQADGGNIYYKFAEVSETIDPTVVVAAGTTLTAATSGSSMQGVASAGYCMKLVSDATVPHRLVWGQDRFLIVRTSTGTATLRLYLSSTPIQ